MNFALSWDIVIFGLLVLLFCYNFILGKDVTIKFIISLYISLLTADAIGSILEKYVFEISPWLEENFGDDQSAIFSMTRIFLFLAGIVVFTVKSAFDIKLRNHDHWAFRMSIHSSFSFLAATFFVATILVYLSGNSFVDVLGGNTSLESDIFNQSLIASILVGYYQFWVSLPAICFLGVSFFLPDKD